MLILLEMGGFYIVMRNSSWVFDDNIFLVLAGQEGFTLHWLDSVKYEHWDVAYNAIFSLQHRLFFLDFRWALIVMLGLLGASAFLLERTLAMIVRNRWITIAFAAWFGLSVLWARPLQWWAAGAQYFPYTLLDLICLYGFLRYYADGGLRWLIVSGAALAAALLFYEKPAYMLLYFVLIRVLLMSEDLRPRTIVANFWRERAIWMTYLAVIGLWGIGYLNSHAYTSHGGVHISQYLTYFRILWLQTLIPSLASVTIPASRLSALQVMFVVFSQIVVLGCVYVSLRRRSSAWRAWTFLAIIIFLSGVLVAHSRIPIFGVDIANDPRYLIDFSWLVPLTLCAAFLPDDTLRPVVSERSARVPISWRNALVPLAVVLPLIYAAGAIASAFHLEKMWAGPQARGWEERLRGGIARLERSGIHPMIANNTTPFEIIPEWLAPYNRLSQVIPLYVGPIQIDGPLDAPLVRIEENGSVRRAIIATVDGNKSLIALVSSSQVNIGSGGRTVRYGRDLCVIADATPVVIERQLTTSLSSADGPYYLLLDYRVWQSVGLSVLVDTGTGYPASPDNTVELSSTTGSSISWLGVEGAPHKVEMIVPPLTTVCMSRFDIATLRDLS